MPKRSLFVRIRNAYEQFQTAGLYNPEESHRNETDQRDMMKDQINAYKEQTNLAKKELDSKRGEQVAEKRKVAEKQIRSIRRSYRPSGFLNNAAQPANNVMGGVVQNLGG